MSIGHSMPDPSQVGLWQLGYWKAGRHGWDWGTAMARVFFGGIGNSLGSCKSSNASRWFSEIEAFDGFRDLWRFPLVQNYCLHLFTRPRDRDLLPSCRTQGPSIMLNAHPSLPMRLPGKTPVVLAHGSNDEVWPALLGP